MTLDPNDTMRLREALVGVLQETHDLYASGKALAIEQAPLIVQEMVRVEIATNSLFAFVGFFAIMLGVWLWYRLEGEFDRGIATIIPCGVGVVVLLSALSDLVRVIAGPRLFIIHESAKLLGLK